MTADPGATPDPHLTPAEQKLLARLLEPPARRRVRCGVRIAVLLLYIGPAVGFAAWRWRASERTAAVLDALGETVAGGPAAAVARGAWWNGVVAGAVATLAVAMLPLIALFTPGVTRPATLPLVTLVRKLHDAADPPAADRPG